MTINLNLDAIGNAFFLLASMFFMHVVADFNLQGIMASMKQKTWWQKQEGYEEQENCCAEYGTDLNDAVSAMLVECEYYFFNELCCREAK